MGMILDILNTIADRISEIKKELKMLREEMRIPKGAISIEGLQRLIANETPEYYELIMALVGLQVAIEHGTETEIFHARNCLTSMLKNQKYSPCSGKYRIDKDRHTDIAKILSSMYEDRIFVTDDGFWASNKKEDCTVTHIFYYICHFVWQSYIKSHGKAPQQSRKSDAGGETLKLVSVNFCKNAIFVLRKRCFCEFWRASAG